MIRFTIITCTFNAESVLQRTLDSVSNQSWQATTHLIIDGKSKDNTVEIAELYKAMSEKESRGERKVKIVSEPDKGLYDAMNKGLRMAEADYVLFLNAGDTFHDNDTLMDIVAEINKAVPCFVDSDDSKTALPGVIYGDTDVVDASNHYVGKRVHQPPEVLTWKSFSNGMLVCHQSFYVRTDIARMIPYDIRYRLSGDVDWCIKVMKETENRNLLLLNTHKVLCNFLAGGVSVKSHKDSLKERFIIMVKHYGLFHTILKHICFTYLRLRKTTYIR